MALVIEVADLGLPALDALDVDALAVFVGPERPLQGLAGFADWRLCGAISRAIRGGLFDADPDDALLLPSGGRMRPSRVFCFGLPAVPLAADAFRTAARGACDAMARAGSAAFASSLPPLAGGDAALAARLWLEASVRRPVTRQVLLGDPRALHRDLSAARSALGAEVELVAPVLRVEMPQRPRVAPYAGGAPR